MNYCQRENKTIDPQTGHRYISGVNCNGADSITEFLATKTAYNKLDGINFYQYVQSFSPRENVTYEQAHAVGLEFAAKAWPGHEVQVSTHCDAQHIHTHFVINSVSFETGLKLRQSPDTLRQLRQLSDEICMAHGLSVLPQYQQGGKKMTAREYRAARKGQSWKFRLMFHIGEAMKTSASQEDFIRQMKHRGYEVLWNAERKHITYTCPNGMKCRCSKLHDDKYLKERMEDEFKKRQQLLTGAIHRGSGENEWGGHDGHGRGSVPARSLRDTQGMAGELADAAGTGCAVPAHPVRDDYPAGNTGGAAKAGDGTEGRSESYETGNSETPDGNRTTGWEFEREIFLRTVQNVLQQSQGNAGGIWQTGQESQAVSMDNPIGFGGGLGIGLGGVSALSRLMDNDSDNPEEQKRRREAAQVATNAGAILGLAMSVISALSKENKSLTWTLDEKQTIEEEEKFNEFLAQMDEEYGYKEGTADDVICHRITKEEMPMMKNPLGEKRYREQQIVKIANGCTNSLVALAIDLHTRFGYSVCCKTEDVHGRN